MNDDDIYYRPKRIVTDEPDFAQQYLGEFATLEMPLEDQLALYYNVRCEQFDRLICTQRDAFGDAMPVYSWQTASINQNARNVMEEIRHAYPQVGMGALFAAIRRYGHRCSTEQMERMLDKLNVERLSNPMLAAELERIATIISGCELAPRRTPKSTIVEIEEMGRKRE